MALTLPLLRYTREAASPNMEQGLEHMASHPRCRAWDPDPLGERIGWSGLDWVGSSGCHTSNDILEESLAGWGQPAKPTKQANRTED